MLQVSRVFCITAKMRADVADGSTPGRVRPEHNESALPRPADIQADTAGGPGRAKRRHWMHPDAIRPGKGQKKDNYQCEAARRAAAAPKRSIARPSSQKTASTILNEIQRFSALQ
jgi:hypothetical protein